VRTPCAPHALPRTRSRLALGVAGCHLPFVSIQLDPKTPAKTQESSLIVPNRAWHPASGIRHPASSIRIPHSAFRIPHSALKTGRPVREKWIFTKRTQTEFAKVLLNQELVQKITKMEPPKNEPKYRFSCVISHLLAPKFATSCSINSEE
jgi:hypothetical protein